MLEFYRQRHLLRDIDGESEIEAVWESIRSLLGSLANDYFEIGPGISYMREAGRIVALALQELGKRVAPGVTTGELDRFAEEFLRKLGAEPAFLGYQGFPASICASVNEEVVHGIPGLRKLENGDIISIDIGAVRHGYVGDAAMTFPVGEISAEAERLLQVTRDALYQGIGQATARNRIGDISAAVQQYVEAHGYQVVRDFVGHGVGSSYARRASGSQLW